MTDYRAPICAYWRRSRRTRASPTSNLPNGRLSPAHAARVKQLEARGLIDAYVALLDRRALGLDVMAFVEVHIDRHTERRPTRSPPR